MKTPKAPAAPDPVATANAQTASNRETAITQQQLNMVDQNTPDGSLTYQQNGTWADGTPRFTSTQTLSPDNQAALNRQNQFNAITDQLGIDQASKLSSLLSKPLDLSNDATEGRLMELGRKRLDPILAQNRASLETNLANKGIQMGSEAWNTAMSQLGQNENDAYNNLLLTGRQQSINEAVQARAAPINEITALMGAQQIGTPNYTNTPSTNVANTDIAGITMQGYQNALDAWKTKVNSQNSIIGSIAGVAGAGLGGWMRSDRRVKEDIRLIGDTGRGFNLYSFAYRGEAGRHVGFMADEVERVHPQAVAEFGGVKHVHYGMLEAL